MIEAFNAEIRGECFNQNWFESLEEAHEQLEAWRKEYNQERPHSSLSDLAPEEYPAHWRQEQLPKKPVGALFSKVYYAPK